MLLDLLRVVQALDEHARNASRFLFPRDSFHSRFFHGFTGQTEKETRVPSAATEMEEAIASEVRFTFADAAATSASPPASRTLCGTRNPV